MTWPCTSDPATWGATKWRADVDAARAGCRRCPRDRDECLTEFALVVDPQASDGMVVGGLHGKTLRGAIRRIRDEHRRDAA